MRLLIYFLGFLSGALTTLLLLIFVVGQDPNALFRTPKQIVAAVAESSEVQKAKAEISRSLFDPYSAQFDSIEQKDSPMGNFVCGYVNAKNRYGGYVGRRAFAFGVIGNMAIIINNKKDAFIWKEFIKICFPEYPIPANAVEANKPD